MAEMNVQKNDKLKNALRIGPNFIEGSSLDPTRRAKEAIASPPKQYRLVEDPEPEPTPEPERSSNKNHKKSGKGDSRKKRRHSSESESDSDSDSSSSKERSEKKRKSQSNEKSSRDRKRRKTREHKSRKHHKYSGSSSGSDSESDTTESSSDSASRSESTSSSDGSGAYNSRNGQKGKRTDRETRKRSISPDVGRKALKSYSELKDSNYGNENNDNKTSHLIAMNIRQVRKEAETTVALDKHKTHETDRKDKEISKGSTEPSAQRRRYSDSRSRSSSRSSEDDSKVKRLKSTVCAPNASIRVKAVPKSYSNVYEHKRIESRDNRSLSPAEKSRHSSRSNRSRSHSVESNGSKSTDRSSRSSAASKSSSGSSSSRSKTRSKSRSKSRSPSIPRRKGSPSFLSKRRITSARKRPIPYRRSSPTSSQSSSHSSRSRSRSRSRCSSRSLSVSSSDNSYNSNPYLIT